VVGARVTKSNVDKRLLGLRYAIAGKIPDGILVRISSVDRATDNAYAMQDQFATDLMQSIAPENRVRFMGDIQ
jgi:hypothetical protein